MIWVESPTTMVLIKFLISLQWLHAFYDKQGILGYIHESGEQNLLALAEENSEKRSLVLLRPAFFMTNHIKDSNKILSCGSPKAFLLWIDTKGMQKSIYII